MKEIPFQIEGCPSSLHGFTQQGAFKPSRLSGLVIWLDSSAQWTLFQKLDLTSPVTAADQPVGAWKSRVGSYKAIQTTDAKRPTFKTLSSGIGSRPTLNFVSTSSQFLSTDRLTGFALAGYTCFVVANFPEGRPNQNYNYFISGTDTSSEKCYIKMTVGGTATEGTRGNFRYTIYPGVYRYKYLTSSYPESRFPAGPTGNFIVNAIIFPKDPSVNPLGLLDTYFNGARNGNPVSIGSGYTDISNADTETIALGCRQCTGLFAFYISCNISEFIIYNRPISEIERVLITRYLANKYKISI